jgi:hypothetical protein
VTPFTLTLAFALAAEPAPAARTDRFGDLLPPGAIQRLGTLRHRTGWPIGPHQRLYLPDGRTLLTFHREFCWTDAASGRAIDTWMPPEGLEISGVSPDGRLALLVNATALHVWDLSRRKELRALPDSNRLRGTSSAIFSPDARQVVLVDQDEQAYRRLRCWDVATGTLEWTNDRLASPGAAVFPLGFRPDGRTLVVQRYDKGATAFVLDRANGRAKCSFDYFAGYPAIAPDGSVLAVACGDAIRVWDLDSGRERISFGQAEGAGLFCAFSPDGTRLASATNGSALIWEWPSARLVKRVPLDLNVHSIAFIPDGKRLAITEHTESLTRFRELDTSQPVPPDRPGPEGRPAGLGRGDGSTRAGIPDRLLVRVHLFAGRSVPGRRRSGGSASLEHGDRAARMARRRFRRRRRLRTRRPDTCLRRSTKSATV